MTFIYPGLDLGDSDMVCYNPIKVFPLKTKVRTYYKKSVIPNIQQVKFKTNCDGCIAPVQPDMKNCSYCGIYLNNMVNFDNSYLRKVPG